jgi:hypothetical protein
VIGGFAVGTSSFLNCTGIFGDQALILEMYRTTEQFSDSAAASRRHADRAIAGLSALRANAAKFDEAEKGERGGGGQSGYRGAGAVAGMYGQVAAVFRAAVQDGEAKAAQVKNLSEQSERKLEAMRAVLADAKLPLAEKMLRFAAETEGLRLGLVAQAGVELDTTIASAARAAREAVPPTLSPNPTVRAQQQQIGNLTESLRQLDSLTAMTADGRPRDPRATFAATTVAFAAETQAPDNLLGKPFHQVTVYAATLAHLGDFLPIAIAVIFVDLLPLPILLINILVRRELDGDGRSDSASRFTVADLMEARRLEGWLAAQNSTITVPPDRRLPPPRVVWTRPA